MLSMRQLCSAHTTTMFLVQHPNTVCWPAFASLGVSAVGATVAVALMVDTGWDSIAQSTCPAGFVGSRRSGSFNFDSMSHVRFKVIRLARRSRRSALVPADRGSTWRSANLNRLYLRLA